MGTLHAVYIRLLDPDTTERLLDEYPRTYTEPTLQFYEINPRSGYRPPESELCNLSARLKTDLILLYYQSVVDAFEFHHWSNGICVRTLVFGCNGPEERSWERVEGTPEPWEEVAPLDRKRMSPGLVDSLLDARETARKVAEYYRLPGWSLASDDTQATNLEP